MKKISFVMKREELEDLERIIKDARETTGFRCTYSEILRSLVYKEAKRIKEGS